MLPWHRPGLLCHPCHPCHPCLRPVLLHLWRLLPAHLYPLLLHQAPSLRQLLRHLWCVLGDALRRLSLPRLHGYLLHLHPLCRPLLLVHTPNANPRLRCDANQTLQR